MLYADMAHSSSSENKMDQIGPRFANLILESLESFKTARLETRHSHTTIQQKLVSQQSLRSAFLLGVHFLCLQVGLVPEEASKTEQMLRQASINLVKGGVLT